MDFSKEIFDNYYRGGNRTVCVKLKNGETFEGRFIGFFRGDQDRNEPYIFRWHFLPSADSLFDYDKTIDPDQGFFIDQSEIMHVGFLPGKR